MLPGMSEEPKEGWQKANDDRCEFIVIVLPSGSAAGVPATY